MPVKCLIGFLSSSKILDNPRIRHAWGQNPHLGITYVIMVMHPRHCLQFFYSDHLLTKTQKNLKGNIMIFHHGTKNPNCLENGHKVNFI